MHCSAVARDSGGGGGGGGGGLKPAAPPHPTSPFLCLWIQPYDLPLFSSLFRDFFGGGRGMDDVGS